MPKNYVLKTFRLFPKSGVLFGICPSANWPYSAPFVHNLLHSEAFEQKQTAQTTAGEDGIEPVGG
jgi:hypothetical protein